jgi:hypothetical protein
LGDGVFIHEVIMSQKPNRSHFQNIASSDLWPTADGLVRGVRASYEEQYFRLAEQQLGRL